MINIHIEVDTPDPDLLRADCEKFARIYCESIARQGAEKIPKRLKEALQDYYDSYAPIYYNAESNVFPGQRTFSFMTDPYTIIHESEVGGVVANGDSMGHPFKGVDEGTIFDWSFMSGYHGFGGFRNAPIVTGTSPNFKMNMWMNDPAVQQEVNNEAENEAKSAGYNYLQF